MLGLRCNISRPCSYEVRGGTAATSRLVGSTFRACCAGQALQLIIYYGDLYYLNGFRAQTRTFLSLLPHIIPHIDCYIHIAHYKHGLLRSVVARRIFFISKFLCQVVLKLGVACSLTGCINKLHMDIHLLMHHNRIACRFCYSESSLFIANKVRTPFLWISLSYLLYYRSLVAPISSYLLASLAARSYSYLAIEIDR